MRGREREREREERRGREEGGGEISRPHISPAQQNQST